MGLCSPFHRVTESQSKKGPGRPPGQINSFCKLKSWPCKVRWLFKVTASYPWSKDNGLGLFPLLSLLSCAQDEIPQKGRNWALHTSTPRVLLLLLVTNNCPNLDTSYTESTFQIIFLLPVLLHLIQDVWTWVFVRVGDWPLGKSDPWGWCIEAVIRRGQIRDAPSGALNFCHARHQTDSYKPHKTLTVGLIIASTPRLMRQAQGHTSVPKATELNSEWDLNPGHLPHGPCPQVLPSGRNKGVGWAYLLICPFPAIYSPL